MPEVSNPQLDLPVGHVYSSDTTIAPSQRLHLILLGVNNVAKSCQFYESLGWKKSITSSNEFVKFDLGHYALCLIAREDLAKDCHADPSASHGFAGIVLIHLAKQPDDVAAILAHAAANGGSIVKPATRTHWGIAGYFKDPDGHLFEVDYEETWCFNDTHQLLVDHINASANA